MGKFIYEKNKLLKLYQNKQSTGTKISMINIYYMFLSPWPSSYTKKYSTPNRSP